MGLTNIASGVENTLIGDTLRYNQFSNIIDTLINRYWVETFFIYTNGVSCVTRSYYNPPSLPSGLDDFSTNNLIVYPNPVSGLLFWNSTIKLKVLIVDLNGRIISCPINYNNKSIDMKDINPGMYFFIGNDSKKKFIKKIIVEK